MAVTLKLLNDYLSDKAEIESLHEELRCKNAACDVSDTVRGSMLDFPYTAHAITVHGMPDEDLKRIEKIKTDIARLRERCRAVEAWVENLDDSQTRRIVRLKFMTPNTSWRQAAMKTGNSEASAKMRVRRAL